MSPCPRVSDLAAQPLSSEPISNGKQRGRASTGISLLARWALFGSLLLSACGSPTNKKAVISAAGKAVINSSGNKSIRFDLMRLGMNEFCRQLLDVGTPLRLADDQPIIGRYYAESCSATILERGEEERMLVRFSGEGFAWTVATGRLGFEAPALLELAADFRVSDDALYVYFRPIVVDASELELLMTQIPAAEIAAQLSGTTASDLASRIISAQLKRGFTAIFHDDDGQMDFSLGLIDVGTSPFSPYEVRSTARATLANGRTEIPAQGRDYVGQIEVKSGQSIFLRTHIEGTDAIDLALLPAEEGKASLDNYLREGASPSFPAKLAYYQKVENELQAQISPPPGKYFLFLDHSDSFGDAQAMPAGLPARVDYLVQVGKK